MLPLETAQWAVTHHFPNPIQGERIHFCAVDRPLPTGAHEKIASNWDGQLRKKQSDLLRQGIETVISAYHMDRSEQSLNALYEGEKVRMWPGPCISFEDIEVRYDSVDIKVAQTSFPFVTGHKDISSLYEREGLPVPGPTLGVATAAITSDNYIALTVRGPRVNAYVNTFFIQGGNPTHADVTVVEHQIKENNEEILVRPDEYVPNFLFEGVGIEKAIGNKPALLGWVNIPLNSDEIKSRKEKSPVNKRPNDAVGVAFAPADEAGLYHYLTKLTHPINFAPNAVACMILYGHAKFGPEWAESVLQNIDREI